MGCLLTLSCSTDESRPLDGDTLALDAAWSDLNSTTFDLNPNLSIPPHDLPSNDFPLIGDMLDVPDDIDWVGYISFFSALCFSSGTAD